MVGICSKHCRFMANQPMYIYESCLYLNVHTADCVLIYELNGINVTLFYSDLSQKGTMISATNLNNKKIFLQLMHCLFWYFLLTI
mmetsp:Transcript_51093/g.76567  ORF Transcript_51093/g.76567 Transcript_51093/m.76567 type:complete len:85 (-) Transcript_51093:1606-1860(-)